MKVYNISKGQLKTLWVLGVIFSISTLFLFFPPIIIIGALVFYTQGWESHNKEKINFKKLYSKQKEGIKKK